MITIYNNNQPSPLSLLPTLFLSLLVRHLFFHISFKEMYYFFLAYCIEPPPFFILYLLYDHRECPVEAKSPHVPPETLTCD